jgi:hypothetical protein
MAVKRRLSQSRWGDVMRSCGIAGDLESKDTESSPKAGGLPTEIAKASTFPFGNPATDAYFSML